MKKLYLFLYIFLICAIITDVGFAQTTIDSNSCAAATSGWTFTNAGGIAIQQSGYWLLDYVGDIIMSKTYDVTTYTNLTLTFQVAAYGSGTNHNCLVEYSTDNGTTWSTSTFTSATPTSSTYITAGTWNIGTLSTSQLKLRWTSPSGGSKGVRIQTIVLKGTQAGLTPPSLIADITDNNVDHNIDIPFIDISSVISDNQENIYLFDSYFKRIAKAPDYT